MNKYIITSIALVVLLLSSCSKDDAKKSVNKEVPIEVSVSRSVESNESGNTTASGKLVAKNSVNISTRMMGYITFLKAEVGQNVRAGQNLVSINSTDIQAKGGQANAQIAQAQAAYNSAKKDFERFQNLFKNQSASQKELDDMRARYEMASAGLQAAQQMKNEVNAQYKYTHISAPISGTITAKYAEQGDMASPGMPILTIESPSNLQVQVLVSEQNINQVSQGMPVKVSLKSINKTVSGTVSEVSKSAANTGGQFMVKVNVHQTQDLLPGMFAHVEFPFKSHGKINQDFQETLTIPTSAVVEQGQLTGVYVISSQNTALLRWVKLGKNLGDKVEVLAGLNSKEQYITNANGRLYNGAKISVK
ncbi:efflux RND transporter periplasmic adaptor subunit [Amniculibacterium aquaticum]|uniref:efflux RND transporter periplasmic adaptor subunit n=1 Tax=Amniculibacterium aquaticum TaxID=2479858 RepID=UPI000F59F1CC|nr:efflux RND transporter periplasmic adaptor subunit [Amniculibacterium aquaticum]